MLVDLACFSVLSQQPPQNSLSPHPLDLGGQTCLGSTLSFTRTGVPTLTFGGVENGRTSTRVNDGGFDDDTALLYELSDVCARVGIANLGLFSGVEPNLVFADTSDGSSKPLLRA